MEGGSSSFGNPGAWGSQKTVPSVVGVWIFSGITHCNQFAPEGKTFVQDSFSGVLQISLTLYVVMSIILQGKTKPLQFISIQNYNLQYIYSYY